MIMAGFLNIGSIYVESIVFWKLKEKGIQYSDVLDNLVCGSVAAAYTFYILYLIIKVDRGRKSFKEELKERKKMKEDQWMDSHYVDLINSSQNVATAGNVEVSGNVETSEKENQVSSDRSDDNETTPDIFLSSSPRARRKKSRMERSLTLKHSRKAAEMLNYSGLQQPISPSIDSTLRRASVGGLGLSRIPSRVGFFPATPAGGGGPLNVSTGAPGLSSTLSFTKKDGSTHSINSGSIGEVWERKNSSQDLFSLGATTGTGMDFISVKTPMSRVGRTPNSIVGNTFRTRDRIAATPRIEEEGVFSVREAMEMQGRRLSAFFPDVSRLPANMRRVSHRSAYSFSAAGSAPLQTPSFRGSGQLWGVSPRLYSPPPTLSQPAVLTEKNEENASAATTNPADGGKEKMN
eukprot:g5385.t1